MAIVRWEPFGFGPNLLDEFLRVVRDTPRPQWNTGDMAVDVYEEGSKLHIDMNLPGVKGEDINVELDNGMLTVAVTREEIVKDERKNYYRQEIRRGSMQRSFAVDSELTANDVSADYSEGILKLTLPIKEKPEETTKVKVNLKNLPSEVEDVEIKER